MNIIQHEQPGRTEAISPALRRSTRPGATTDIRVLPRAFGPTRSSSRWPTGDSSADWSRFSAGAQFAFGSGSRAPASFRILARSVSCFDYLDDAAAPTATLQLPVLDCGLFAIERRQTPQPENARPCEILGGEMVKQHRWFADNFAHIESILHQQENVHVVRLQLIGDKRAVKNETRHPASLVNELVNVLETPTEHHATWSAQSKALDDLCECGFMNSSRQVTGRCQWWPFLHLCAVNKRRFSRK